MTEEAEPKEGKKTRQLAEKKHSTISIGSIGWRELAIFLAGVVLGLIT